MIIPHINHISTINPADRPADQPDPDRFGEALKNSSTWPSN